MLFKKSFLRKAVQSGEGKVRTKRQLSFLISKESQKNIKYGINNLSKICLNILNSEDKLNSKISHLRRRRLIDKRWIDFKSENYINNFIAITSSDEDCNIISSEVIELYSKLEGLKFFPSLVTSISVSKDNSKFLILKYKKVSTADYRDIFPYTPKYSNASCMRLIYIMSDVKKMYDIGLRIDCEDIKLSDFYGNENFIDGHDFSYMYKITVNKSNETYEEFARNFLIKCFIEHRLGPLNNIDIDECTTPNEYTNVISKELFYALKREDVSGVDFISLLCDVFKFNKNFDFVEERFNKDLYIISPNTFKISITDKYNSKYPINSEELLDIHKLSCKVIDNTNKYFSKPFLYHNITSRVFNYEMDFLGIRTRCLKNCKKAEFRKCPDKEYIVKIYKMLSETIRCYFNIIHRQCDFGFDRFIDIDKDLYEMEDRYLLSGMSMLTLNKDKTKDRDIITIFILEVLRKISDYDVLDSCIEFKNNSLINYFSLNIIKMFENYVLFLKENNLNDGRNIIEDDTLRQAFYKICDCSIASEFTDSIGRIFPCIFENSLHNFKNDGIYEINSVKFEDKYVSGNYILDEGKANPIRTIIDLVYDRETLAMKGYILRMPVEYTHIFSEEFFNQVDEKQLIQVIINLAKYTPYKDYVVSYDEEFVNNSKYIVDKNLNIYFIDSFEHYNVPRNGNPFNYTVISAIQRWGEVRNSKYLNIIDTYIKDANPKSSHYYIEEVLEEVYNRLTVKHKVHGFWYDGDDKKLAKILFPGDVLVDVDTLKRVIYKGQYNTIYDYNSLRSKKDSEYYLDVYNTNIVDMENAPNAKLNSSEKLARNKDTFEVVGFYGKISYLEFYNEMRRKINYSGAVNIKATTYPLIVFSYLNSLVEFLYKYINSKNTALFTNYDIKGEFYSFFKFVPGSPDALIPLRICYLNLKSNDSNEKNIDYEYYVSTFINEIISKTVLAEELNLYLSSEDIRLLKSSNPDLKKIRDMLNENLDCCTSGYCYFHKIHYNSNKFFLCPKCSPDEVNFSMVDVEKLGEKMKKGGESLIFEKDNDTLYKIYRKNQEGKYIVDIPKKLAIISQWTHIKDRVTSETSSEDFTIIMPNSFLRDSASKDFCGFSLDKVKDAKPISVLMDIEYAKQVNWTQKDILKVLINLGKALNYLAKNNWYIGDFNGGNILFDKNYHVYVIDTDSLGGIAGNAPVAFVETFLDPKAITESKVNTSITTDYYSYAIIAFSSLTGLHPFDGIYRVNKKIIPKNVRMSKGISVLGKRRNIKIPDTIFKWDWMSNKLIKTFLSIFEGDVRESILPYLEEELERLNNNDINLNCDEDADGNTENVKEAEDVQKSNVAVNNIKIYNSDGTQIELVSDCKEVQNIGDIVSTKIALMTSSNNTFYDILNGKTVECTCIPSYETIVDVWFTPDNYFYSVLTEKNIYYINSSSNELFKSFKIFDHKNVKHSKSGNRVFFTNAENEIQMIKYKKKKQDIECVNKTKINTMLKEKFGLHMYDFYISKEASVIAFLMIDNLSESYKLQLFDVNQNEPINYINIPYLNPFKLNVFFDYSGEDYILLTSNSDLDNCIYSSYDEETSQQSSIDVERDIGDNSVLYKGILFYPMDGYIGAINLVTHNQRKFECKVCTKNCKVIRITNGFKIIDNENKKIYKHFV